MHFSHKTLKKNWERAQLPPALPIDPILSGEGIFLSQTSPVSALTACVVTPLSSSAPPYSKILELNH